MLGGSNLLEWIEITVTGKSTGVLDVDPSFLEIARIDHLTSHYPNWPLLLSFCGELPGLFPSEHDPDQKEQLTNGQLFADNLLTSFLKYVNQLPGLTDACANLCPEQLSTGLEKFMRFIQDVLGKSPRLANTSLKLYLRILLALSPEQHASKLSAQLDLLTSLLRDQLMHQAERLTEFIKEAKTANSEELDKTCQLIKFFIFPLYLIIKTDWGPSLLASYMAFSDLMDMIFIVSK